MTYARDLHDQPFIALSREEGRQVLVDRALHAAGVRPREVVAHTFRFCTPAV